MNALRVFREVWLLLLLGCVLLISTADALLLQAGQTFFTAGFNGTYIEGGLAVAGFVVASGLVDLCLVLGVWCCVLSVLARVPGTAVQKLVAASIIALAIPLTYDFALYRVGEVLGRMVSIPLLFEVSAGGLQLMASEASQHAQLLFATLFVATVASGALVHVIGRTQRATGWGGDVRIPRTRSLLRALAVLTLIAGGVLVLAAVTAPPLRIGLAQKPSVAFLDRLVLWTTDLDRDGFGLLSRPADPAPFDASRHPFALDLPGNGIDENGMAGDLPAGAVAPASVRFVPGPAATRRPHFLLVYLESFRADLLGRRRAGREITPFLNGLARAGSQSERAYVHSPYTIWSRAQLYGGTVTPQYGQATLVDDFHERGYRVAHFSGQDDSFGRSIELLGLDRVDHLYDARQDRDRNTSRGRSAGSLQVSASVVLERVTQYLDGYDFDQPLFLYVNLVDTHFPYTHDEVVDRLGVEPIARSQISAANKEAVRATYESTAAYVDAAIEDLVARLRSRIGGRDHAILVLSDHGQALFDHDFLGHGQGLTQEQTRTPFVLWGVGGEWPEPLGMADVRGLLLRNLFAPLGSGVPRARFVPDPDRRLLHFMAQVSRPRLIGLRSLDRLISFDVGRESLEALGPDEQPLDLDDAARERAFRELIWAWEATRVESGERGAPRPRGRPPGPA